MPEESQWAGFFDPPALLAALGLRNDDEIVDFGSGYGTFALAAAAATRGAVHALELDTALVGLLRARAARAGLANLHVHACDFLETATPLPAARASMALAFNILHVEHPHRLLGEAARLLAAGGRLAVIHWQVSAETPRGPPLAIRPQPWQVTAWAGAHGFGPAQTVDLGAAAPWHYGLLLERNAAPG